MSLWTCSQPWFRLDAPPGRFWLVLSLVAAVAWPLAAQPAPVQEPLVTETYTLHHRPAADAIAVVQSLLSERGTVELQPQGNSLVLRDTRAVVRRALARLREYDQPLRQIRLEIQIVEAGDGSRSGPPGSPRLSDELVRRLRELLRFESFLLVAEAGLEMREGEHVVYQFGGDYRVEFELGVLTSNSQLRLGDFIVGRGPTSEARTLIHTNLNLMLGRPMVLGLAQTESSARALMVVLTSHLLPLEGSTSGQGL